MNPEFPGNANKDKDAKKPAPKTDKKIEKVVSGQVTERKKPFGQRFKDTFFGGEFRAARGYVVSEVLLPALRNLIVDATSKGIERMIYGDVSPRRPASRGGYGSPKIQYNSPVQRERGPIFLPDQPPRSRGRRQEINDILFVSREEAELVLERMVDIINDYDVVSKADLNELAGLQSTYVDNNWGWVDLRYASVRQTRDGFLLDLPPYEPLA